MKNFMKRYLGTWRQRVICLLILVVCSYVGFYGGQSIAQYQRAHTLITTSV